MQFRTLALMGLVAVRTSSIGLGFVPLAAVCLLGGCADTPADLDSGDPVSRLEAVQRLAARGDAAVERLAQGTGHEDPMTARAAVRALGGIHSRSATEALARTARSEPRPAVRLEAAIALGLRPGEESVETLKEVLRTDQDVAVRGVAATALGRVGSPPDALSLLDAAEKETDASVQSQAVGAVSRLLGLGFVFDARADAAERSRQLRMIRGEVNRRVEWMRGLPAAGGGKE